MPLLQLRVGLVSAAWSCSLEAVGYCSGVVSGLLAPGFVLGNLGVAQAAGASGAVAVVALALAHTQLFLWMCARHLHWSCRGLWASGARCTSGLIFVRKSSLVCVSVESRRCDLAVGFSSPRVASRMLSALYTLTMCQGEPNKARAQPHWRAPLPLRVSRV